MSPDDLEATEHAVIAAHLGWDSIPESEMTRARAIVRLHSIDAELAELVAAPEGSLVGARSDVDEVQSATFTTGSLTIEVEAVADGVHANLAGQLLPSTSAHIEVERVDQLGGRDSRAGASADGLGRFSLRVPCGVVRLRVTLDGALESVCTEFFRV